MTGIILDSGAMFEIRESKLFLKEDDSYIQIERIERLIEILNGSESVDIIFKLDPESICFEIERKTQRTDNEGKEKYVVEKYPAFVILLLYEFKQIKLSIEETSYILVPRRKFKEKEILEVVNNAPCAWLAVDPLYPLGRLMDYFTDPEIFVKNRLEGKSLFDDFQTRLKESKTRLENFKSENSIPEYSELVVFTMNRIEELLDFFLESTEISNKIDEFSKSEISKISIFSEFLMRFERLTKNFLGLMVHVISRLVSGKKLVSLQLFSILMDITGELTYETIRLTAGNIFDVDNLFKLEKDQRKNLLDLTSKWGEAKEFKRLRNVSPLSHRFEPIDLGMYTAEKIIEILSPFHNFLTNLLYDNIKLIKKRIENEEDEKLQGEIALIGVSTDDVWDYIYQLEDVLSAISKFTPSQVAMRLKYLRNLYLNLFLLLSFFEEIKIEGDRMKHSHIISVGTSILNNYCKENNLDQKQLDVSRLLHNKTFVNELVAFVDKDPKKASAELNALYSYSEKFNVQIDEAYLILTDTDECELCGRVLERVLRQRGTDVHMKRVRGHNIKGGDFYEGLVEFLKTIAEKVKSWKDRKIYFNATGGFKPEVSLLVTIGSTLGIPTYYRHEIIGDVVEIPPFPIMLAKDVMEKLEPFIRSQSGRLYSITADELLLKNHLIQPIHGERGEVRGYEITPIGKLMWNLWRVAEELK